MEVDETDSEAGDACARHITVSAVLRWTPSFSFTYICISCSSFFLSHVGIPHCTVFWVGDGYGLLLLILNISWITRK